jgi:hypothetical protein
LVCSHPASQEVTFPLPSHMPSLLSSSRFFMEHERLGDVLQVVIMHCIMPPLESLSIPLQEFLYVL